MSLRGAINAMCKACIHDPHCGGGTWRQQVAACTSPGCPLYPHRPLPDYRDRRTATAPAADSNVPPYPWCHTPAVCSAKGYCTRNPGCGD
jgi:hypothetical protein